MGLGRVTWSPYLGKEIRKVLLRRCPMQGFDPMSQVHTIYNGLKHGSREIVDAVVEETMFRKTSQQALKLIE